MARKTNSGRSNSGRSGSSRRGFAAMDPDEQRRIASKGGRAAHHRGSAHEWNSREASEAGRKGGRESGGNRRNTSSRSSGREMRG